MRPIEFVDTKYNATRGSPAGAGIDQTQRTGDDFGSPAGAGIGSQQQVLLAEHMTLDQAAALMGVTRATPGAYWRITGKTAPLPLPMATGAAGQPTLFPRRSGAGWSAWLARCMREPTTPISQSCSVNARVSTWAGPPCGASWSTPGSAVRGAGARPSTGCAASGCPGEGMLIQLDGSYHRWPHFIFRWPPVLAQRHSNAEGSIMAMLTCVLLWQGRPGGRPGSEGGVDHSAQSAYDSARSSSGDSRRTARLIAVDHRGSLVRPSA